MAIRTEARERIKDFLVPRTSYRDRKKRQNAKKAEIVHEFVRSCTALFSWGRDWTGARDIRGQRDCTNGGFCRNAGSAARAGCGAPANTGGFQRPGKDSRVNALAGTHAGGSAVGVSATPRDASGAARK